MDSENSETGQYEEFAGLRVQQPLADFISSEALVGLEFGPDTFWSGFRDILETLTPRLMHLLSERGRMQRAIDQRHQAQRGAEDEDEVEFLQSIGYLVPEPANVSIRTKNVDAEIALLAGPQLVVPATNSRYLLNAVNARWGSLYDAFYGTDVIPDVGSLARHAHFNEERGTEVARRAAICLDRIAPLVPADSSHLDAIRYVCEGAELVVCLSGGRQAYLADSSQFAGLVGPLAEPKVILLVHNGLHVELRFDREHPVGAAHPAGLADIVLEAALSTIIDCEDSVATVDAQDKVTVYRNWLGLVRGTLTATLNKNGTTITRRLAPDRRYRTPRNSTLDLRGRSLMLVRNVGHHMFSHAVLDADGAAVPEGFLDAAITALIGARDLWEKKQFQNSRFGSIYIVKPKMHGSDEVGLTVDLFGKVERMLALPANTIKLGIMDEERRTSVNLAACVAQARERIVFINTGFLDRTGDEIHTSMHAGPVVRKSDMKGTGWITAYEQRNVAIGLASGLRGRGQIGKGMWTAPDRMAEMLSQKIEHPRAGASTAWVPSPTAATLHALHYHEVNVQHRQDILAPDATARRLALLRPPLLGTSVLTSDEIRHELNSNLHSILGYVVHWVNQGIGCSKVPDLDEVGLMEDRATLRISSQLVANWLLHGLVSEEQVTAAFRSMAIVVDEQNVSDPFYKPMASGFDGEAFQAARELVFNGMEQPNGYTENILCRWRLKAKEGNSYSSRAYQRPTAW